MRALRLAFRRALQQPSFSLLLRSFRLHRASLLFLPLLAAADFQIREHRVAPGTRADFELPVPAGSDPATHIPVTVIHGVKAGPTLLISAGIHGAEYVPVLAAQDLLKRLVPKTMAGTVIVVPVAHVASFERATVYYNPFDHKNLARVFPGKPDGTQTERIAHIFTTELLRRADVLIDLHGGDATESLHPFVGVYGGTLAARQYPLAKRIGLALGFQTIVRYRMDTLAQVDGANGRSPNRQAVADGKAAVLVEVGDQGRRDAELVRALADGLVNALHAMEMVPGSLTSSPPRVEWITATASAAPSATGIFYPLKTAGSRIWKGDKAGYVTDLFGKVVDELVAPADGLILYMPFAPPLNAGPASPLVIGIAGTPE